MKSFTKGKPSNNRGFILLEIAIALGIILMISAAIVTVQVQTVRIRREGEIASATIHVLAGETQRLRSLPLTMFYDGIGNIRSDLVYFRPLLETSASDGVGSGRMYARISVHLDMVTTSGGPVQVTIGCRPVYLNAPPSATSRPGVNTASTSSFLSTTPSGVNLGVLEETQTFFVL